jgi:hypothetical protein
LAAQVRKPPCGSETGLSACPLNPSGCIVGDSRQNTKGFLAEVANQGRPNRSPTGFGEEKGSAMKFATVSKSLVLGFALVLASSAFATTKGNLQLTNAVTVNGTQLNAGDYKVQWEGSGPNVEVSIMKGKNVVAKAPARVVELHDAAVNDAAVLHKNDSGPETLAGLRFEGKRLALELSAAGDGGQADGSSK